MRVSGSSTWRQCDWEITPQRFARGYVPGTSWLHVHHYDLDTNPAAKIMAHRGTHENPGVRIDEYEVGIRRDHPVWFARQYDKIFPHPKGDATLRLPFKLPLRNTGYPRDDD